MLDDLVRGVLGASATDGDGARALAGDGVLTDVLEPDVVDSAGTLAVHAFHLVLANDDVSMRHD